MVPKTLYPTAAVTCMALLPGGIDQPGPSGCMGLGFTPLRSKALRCPGPATTV